MSIKNGTADNKQISIGLILGKLRKILLGEISQLLDKQRQEGDTFTGIIIAGLPNQGSIISADKQIYKFYAARVFPGKHVNPHFHSKGMEPYKILKGDGGIMHIGKIDGQTITWSSGERKNIGDEIIINENEVHSFENIGNEPIDFIFSCPDSHLKDEDRTFTMNFINGTPQYLNVD